MIKILGKKYTVKKVPENDLNEDCIGRCREKYSRISVLEGMTEESTQATILHEVLHAIDFAMSIELSEKQVGALANGLFAFFKDNNIGLEQLEIAIDE